MCGCVAWMPMQPLDATVSDEKYKLLQIAARRFFINQYLLFSCKLTKDVSKIKFENKHKITKTYPNVKEMYLFFHE